MVASFKKVMACALLLMAQSQIFSINYTATQDYGSSKLTFDLVCEEEGSGESFRLTWPAMLTAKLKTLDEEVVITFTDEGNLGQFVSTFAGAIEKAERTMTIEGAVLTITGSGSTAK